MNNKKVEQKDKQDNQYIIASKEEVEKILDKSNKKNKRLLFMLANR